VDPHLGHRVDGGGRLPGRLGPDAPVQPQLAPHTRFHDALTITLGSLLGVGRLYFLEKKDPGRNLALGTLLPSLFWIAQGLASFFPELKGSRPSFRRRFPG
jgi:hypothetical protein